MTSSINQHVKKCSWALGPLLALSLTPIHTTTAAGSSHRFTVNAKVLSVQPIYRQVLHSEPQKHCWTEQERYVIRQGTTNRHHNSSHSHRQADPLVGGVIGGVIGNQLGRHGSSGVRAGATVAGAIIGSVIANEVNAGHSYDANRRHRHQTHGSRGHETVYGTRPVQRCNTVVNERYVQQIDGYDVTYEHRGRQFKTRTRRDPGPTIKLRINVEPITGQ